MLGSGASVFLCVFVLLCVYAYTCALCACVRVCLQVEPVLGEQNTMGEEDMTHMTHINPHTNAQRLYWGLGSAPSRVGLSWGVILRVT